MSGREDGLPHPLTGEQQYLAAILDELRGLSATLSPPARPEAPAAEEVEPELTHVSEPVAAGVGDPMIPTGAETASEDAGEAAPSASKPAPAKPKGKSQTRKRTTRKRAK